MTDWDDGLSVDDFVALAAFWFNKIQQHSKRPATATKQITWNLQISAEFNKGLNLVRDQVLYPSKIL